MLLGASAFAIYRYRNRKSKTPFATGAQPQDVDTEQPLNVKSEDLSDSLTPGDTPHGKNYQLNDA